MIVANQSTWEQSYINDCLERIRNSLDSLVVCEQTNSSDELDQHLHSIRQELNGWGEYSNCLESTIAWNYRNAALGGVGLIFFEEISPSNGLPALRCYLERAHGWLLRRQEFINHFLQQIEGLQIEE